AEDANPAVKQAHTCEANFYGGQYALIEGQRDEAVKLFEAAAKDCPHGFLEGIAAAAELKGMGQKVGANERDRVKTAARRGALRSRRCARRPVRRCVCGGNAPHRVRSTAGTP